MNEYKTIECPWCHAQPGASCVNKDGTAFKTGVHMSRFSEVQKRRGEGE